jgi:hypothetical protein
VTTTGIRGRNQESGLVQVEGSVAEASGEPVSLVCTTRNGTRAQQLDHHPLARREVEREESRRLTDRHAQVGRVLEFLANALNEFAKEWWCHKEYQAGLPTRRGSAPVCDVNERPI